MVSAGEMTYFNRDLRDSGLYTTGETTIITPLPWGIDGLANRLAYRFILKPQGASFVDFFSIPPYLWLGAILFALLVSIAAALYPASRAARIDPVRALRHD